MKLTCFLLAVASGAWAQAKAPRPAPEFKIAEPSGRTEKLSSYRGDVVLLAFIVTSCSHCQTASKEFGKLQSDFGRRGVSAALAAFDEGADRPVRAPLRTYISGRAARTKCAHSSASRGASESLRRCGCKFRSRK